MTEPDEATTVPAVTPAPSDPATTADTPASSGITSPPNAAATAAVRALRKVSAQLSGGGETRTGQETMTHAVAEAISAQRHIVVQAGTGTGKSLGYLVPAIVAGQRVVVATATKALQDQLAGKDLPFLQEHLGTEFEFALLKGRSNYFCYQRAAEFGRDSDRAGQLRLEDGAKVGAPLAEEIRKLMVWAGTTSIGDRAELEWEPSPAAWATVSISAGECPGAARCPMGADCFAEAARTRAAHADVVVVNTHLWGQHVRSGGFILPEHDVVILDECHEVEDILADSLGSEIGSGRFIFLLGRLRGVLTEIEQTVDFHTLGRRWDDVLVPLVGQRLAGGPAAHDDLRALYTLAADQVERAMSMLRNVPDDAGPDVAARKVRAMQAATGLLDDLRTALSSAPEDAGRVCWVEAGVGRGSPSVRVAPVDVSDTLASTIWDRTTAVLTSATVPQRVLDRLGLPPEKTTVIDVGSPFDYPTQALLYCAVDLPDPRSPKYPAALHNELEWLMRAAGGRTLALFTSWRAMHAALEQLRMREFPFTIFAQGELPKPALITRFSQDETSCLFATMGFWQGVDIPGRALSVVAIDKLPFSRPDEPLAQARRERAGPRAFELIDLPRAATLLAQGAGRLIRTRDDLGVVAVLDPRLNSAGYRWSLIKQLPPMRRTRHRADVEAFLAPVRGDVGEGPPG